MISSSGGDAVCRWCWLLAWLLPVAAVAGRPPERFPVPPHTEWCTVTAGGLTRRYAVHHPPAAAGPAGYPVVIMFHGGGGRARVSMYTTDWPALADSAVFLAVFPEGTPPDPRRPASFRDNPASWNDGSQRPTVGAAERGVPDVAFVRVLLADLARRFPVDRRRIYATGFSNGASLVFRLAHELPGVFAAIAPVAGVDWLWRQPLPRPVPLLYISGDADPLNPLAGGEVRIGRRSYGRKMPLADLVARWAALDGCDAGPQTRRLRDGLRVVSYARHGDPGYVVWYTVAGQGHHWPGGRPVLPGRLVGPATGRLAATRVIWDFFTRHTLPAIAPATVAGDSAAGP